MFTEPQEPIPATPLFDAAEAGLPVPAELSDRSRGTSLTAAFARNPAWLPLSQGRR